MASQDRYVYSVVKKWVKVKQNAGVVRWANNQTFAPRHAHEQRHVHMISKGMFIGNETNSYSCWWFTKEACN